MVAGVAMKAGLQVKFPGMRYLSCCVQAQCVRTHCQISMPTVIMLGSMSLVPHVTPGLYQRNHQDDARGCGERHRPPSV